MATVDVAYAWGTYNNSGGEWASPRQVPNLGTGGSPSPLGAVQSLNGEAGWWTYVVGGVPYGIGLNDGNQLSQTATAFYTSPQGIAATSDGGSSPLGSMIQLDGGDLWCWGINSLGQVYAWGDSNSGVLGNNGSTTTQPVPTLVLGIGGTGHLTLDNVAGSVSGGSGHAIGKQAAKTCIGCGGNTFGELGNNNLGTNSNVPVQVLGGAQGGTNLSNIIYVSVGNKHSLALEANASGGTGRVFAWGMGTLGQLGNNQTANNEAVPVLVDFAAAVGGTVTLPIVAISGGGGTSGVDGQSFFIDSAGLLWACGANTYGQLGLGTNSTPSWGSTAPPVSVPTLVNIPLSGGQTVVAASSGGRHGMALRSDGILFVFGDNTQGALGNPALNTPIPGISGAIGTSVPTPLNQTGSTPSPVLPTVGTINSIWAGNATSTIDISVELIVATALTAGNPMGMMAMV